MTDVQAITPAHDLCSKRRLNPSKADQSIDIGGSLSLHPVGVDGLAVQVSAQLQDATADGRRR